MKSKRIFNASYPRHVVGGTLQTDVNGRTILNSTVMQELIRDLEPSLLERMDWKRLELIEAFLFGKEKHKPTAYLRRKITPDFFIALKGLHRFIKEESINSFEQLDIKMNIKKQQFLSSIEPCECYDQMIRQHFPSPPKEK